MKIAVSGLGRMGAQIAQKLSEGGHEVLAHNRSPQPIDEAVAHGAIAARQKEDVVKAFAGGRAVVWIMLPAEIIDSELDKWLQILPQGSLLIDGGNSDFRLDKERADRVAAAGSRFLDVGTSGGIWGYKNGFCMMAGGDPADYAAIEPVLKTLAAPAGGYDYFGPNGAGHFVKMVHNAIEYGMMQSLAEGYLMLKDGPFKDLDLAKAGRVWQKRSVITSWLNELAADSLAENPQLQGIDGAVAETGEARWTLEVAKAMAIPMPAIQSAFEVRRRSQQGDINFATKLVAAIRNKFGGHDLNPKK